MPRAALVLLASLCVLCPRVARAEDDSVWGRIQGWFSNLGKPPPPPPPEDLGARNTFTVNPLALRYQQLGVEYERAFGGAFSMYAAPEFAYGSASGGWQLSLGGTVGMRFFVLGSAPSGIFFGPEVSVLYERTDQGGELRRALGLGLGGSVGASLVLFNRFALSAGFAAEYRSIPDPATGALQVQILPVPRLAFGAAF